MDPNRHTGLKSAVLKAGLAYFGLVFAAGFLLGTIRVVWLVPRIGERTAELAEIPLMLLVSVLAARGVVRRFAIPPSQRLGTGFLALALLLGAEIGVGVWITGQTVAGVLTNRDPVSGTAYFLALGLFAVMPALVWRSRH